MNDMIESKRLLTILKRKRAPKLKTIEDVSDYVTRFVIKRYKLDDATEINSGYCFIWAYLVWALMKEPVKFVMNDGHVVIDYQGKYYDSVTFGLTDIDNVITGASYDGDAQEISVYGMAWYWARCGTYRRHFRKILKSTSESIYSFAAAGGFDEDGKDLYDGACISMLDIP
jgi:hypothetical protein